jgi:hypothetical protein
LHLAEFWFNTSWHSALASSPFQVPYGHAPRTFGIDPTDASPITSLTEWLNERELMQHLIHQHLLRGQDRMKKQADKKRSERQFQVGDMVFLKLQPYVQSSLAPRTNQKLAYKFVGPFKVLDHIGAVAYNLQLPKSSSIHPIFHVSLLKVAPPAHSQVSPSLPDSADHNQVLDRVLQKRLLVKWSNMSEELATWENLDDLKRRFPPSPTPVQADSLRRGC